MSRKVASKGDEGKKKKQQAASLARRMAGKKGQTAQLQVEVNNEEDWEKLLQREGLILIDVYSEWSGPCVGMLGNLKKAKVDLGGEALQLAIAKNDEIEALTRFRNKSEPTWMFVAGGLLVNVVFGANAPRLMKMIDFEVKHEAKVLKGETWRRGGPFSELSEEERERAEIAERAKSEAVKREEERRIREIEEKRTNQYKQMAENLLYETVIVCLPHTILPELGCVLLSDIEMFLRDHKMYISGQTKMRITKEIFDEVFYRGSLEATDELFEDLNAGNCLILLLKCQIIASPGQDGEKKLGNIEKLICESLNMVELEEDQELVIPDIDSIPGKNPYVRRVKEGEGEGVGVGVGGEEDAEDEDEEKEITSVPGCWTPATYLTKSAAVKYFFPMRAEKVMPPEEPPIPGKVVIAFDISKQKECYDLIEEYPDDVLNVGYFSGMNPDTAEHLCATPEQYAKLTHEDTNKLVVVVKKVKSEPLLSFAGLGAFYISLDEKLGMTEADLFFPPDVEPKFPRLAEAERLLLEAAAREAAVEEEAEEEEVEEEQEEQDEDDLMALLGL